MVLLNRAPGRPEVGGSQEAERRRLQVWAVRIHCARGVPDGRPRQVIAQRVQEVQAVQSGNIAKETG